MKILGKMIMDGNVASLEQVAQYAGHIAETCLLGQKKHWPCVVQYNDAHQEAQAIEQFPWGHSGLRDKRDLKLEDKHDCREPSGQKSGGNPKCSRGNAGQGKSHNQGKGKPPENYLPDQELHMCRDFNTGTCTHTVCRFLHLCTMCGLISHGLDSHPN